MKTIIKWCHAGKDLHGHLKRRISPTCVLVDRQGIEWTVRGEWEELPELPKKKHRPNRDHRAASPFAVPTAFGKVMPRRQAFTPSAWEAYAAEERLVAKAKAEADHWAKVERNQARYGGSPTNPAPADSRTALRGKRVRKTFLED